MALTPFQQAVSQLARSMGLRGEQEKLVYNTPEFQQIQRRFFPSQDPATVPADQGAAEQALLVETLNRLRSQFDRPAPSLDLTPFQSAINSINTALTSPVALPTLQQSDLDNLAAMKTAQQAFARQSFERDQGKLLAGLFGQGVPTSTIATDAVGRMLQDQTLIGQQIESDFARQQLGLQQALAQLRQGNLALAGQNAIGQGNMAIAGFTSENDAISQLINQMIASIGQQQGIGLQRQGLNEGARMNMLDFGEKQRQFDEQMAAQKRSWLTSLIGMGASLATAAIPGVGPFISGGISSIFNRNPAGKPPVGGDGGYG